MIASAVYVLCAVTSILCAMLLLRAYRRRQVPLLFWSAWCFAGLALNNILLFVDLVIVPDVDLSLVRSLIALVSLAVLVHVLIWDVHR